MRHTARLVACVIGAFGSLLLIAAAQAQPTDARVTKYDNVHLRVSDPAAAAEWYVKHLGAMVSGPRGARFGETVIAFVRAEKLQPSAGSVIDHIAVSFPDLSARMKAWTAAAVKITVPPSRNASGLEAGFVEDPWGTRIEVLQDPQTLGFHHVHLNVPDPEVTLAWFERMIGGERAHQEGHGLRYGTVAVLIDKSGAATPAPSADRAIMNIAFRVLDIKKAIAELRSKGVQVITEPTAIGDLWYAFVEGPRGVRVELLQRPS